MMRSFQSRWQSLLEATANVVVGFLVALVLQALLYPAFGITTTLATDSTIAVVFTLVSLVRSYAVRRFFEALDGPGPVEESRRHARP